MGRWVRYGMLFAALDAACTPFGSADPPPPAVTDPAPELDAGLEAGIDATVPAEITWRGISTARAATTLSESELTVPGVGGVADGDVLLAGIAVGDNSNVFPAPPVLTVPEGWTEVRRVEHGTAMVAGLYVRVAAGATTSATWKTDRVITGVGWIAAYGGVDVADPIDAVNDRVIATKGKSFATPSLTTAASDTMLVVGLFGKAPGGTATPRWTMPDALNERAVFDNGGTRSAGVGDLRVPNPGAVDSWTVTSDRDLDYAILFGVALRPR